LIFDILHTRTHARTYARTYPKKTAILAH